MSGRLTCATIALMVGFGAVTARADETTLCNAYITTLPYTITKQGHYCFDRNLSTAITIGSAINIAADYVVLDLNNFKLGGGAAGDTSSAIGIASVNHRNITIRNGNIRGFSSGIVLLDEGNSAGHLIEHNLFDGNLSQAITVEGDGVVIRYNRVINTGRPRAVTAVGIDATGGTAFAHDNFVSNVFGGSAFNQGVRLQFDQGIAANNVVKFEPGTPNAIGIVADICRGNTVRGAPGNICAHVVDGDAIVP